MVDHYHSREQRFAGYIQISSANEDADVQRRVAADKEAIHGFVSDNGSGTVVWYVDKGSGSALPALQALLADAGSPDRDFDTVLVVSRDWPHFIPVRRALQDAGVKVHAIDEAEDASSGAEFLEAVAQMVEAFYKECRSEAARQGWRTRRTRAGQDQGSAQG